MKTYFVERIGEQVFAKIVQDRLVEVKIIRNSNCAHTGQEFIARIKTIDMRLSAAFIDLGDELALLQFNAPRPKYVVEGALVMVKITRPSIGNKLAVAKYIGDTGTKYKSPQLIKNCPHYGDWPTPIAADDFIENIIIDGIEAANINQVNLQNGGSITIETTRAMTTIDVDAGARIAGGTNQNNFNHKLNIEAANEIARQIILRNISGIIAIDFVGSPSKLEAPQLYEILQKNLKNNTKCEILPISKFGVCEIARERNGASLNEVLTANPAETIAIQAINSLAKKLATSRGTKLILNLNQAAFTFLQTCTFNWQEYIKKKIGGQYSIKPQNIQEFDITQ